MAARRQQGGQDAAHGPDAPVEAELAHEDRPGCRFGGHEPRAGKHGCHDRKVVVAARLRQAGRSQVDGEQSVGPAQSRTGNRGLAPVASLVQGSIGKAHQDGTWKAGTKRCLDLDGGPPHAHQGH